jgi:hypothetical protein
MKTFLYSLIVLLVASVYFSSCKDFSEDLEEIGQKLAKIQHDTITIEKELSSYEKIVKSLYSHKGITDVVFNAEKNCYVLHFVEGDSLILSNGLMGADGKSILADAIGVTKIGGKTYWTVNDTLMKDSVGKPVEVVPLLGKGQDVTTMTVPVVRINPSTGKWQITTETYFDGITWRVKPGVPESVWKDLDVNVSSKGETGDRGEQGPPGEPGVLKDEVFEYVKVYDSDGDGSPDSLVIKDKKGFIYYIDFFEP